MDPCGRAGHARPARAHRLPHRHRGVVLARARPQALRRPGEPVGGKAELACRRSCSRARGATTPCDPGRLRMRGGHAVFDVGMRGREGMFVPIKLRVMDDACA